jgi:hypothetical protein
VAMSKNQADKAGKRLRHFAAGSEVLEFEEWVEAFESVSEWRGLHQTALTKTVVGLRSAVATSCQLRPHGRVVSRLKTEDKIFAKLCRESTRLSSIYDIAGCRAILPTNFAPKSSTTGPCESSVTTRKPARMRSMGPLIPRHLRS